MSNIDPDSKQYLWSSYREMLLEHIFVGEILKNAWLQHKHIEVLRPQTDDAGYDVLLGCGGIYRHVQLKTKGIAAKARSVNLNQSLSTPDKSGCVIWIVFNPETIELGPFLWFGGSPGEPLPDISLLPVAKHTKGDSDGIKRERPNIRSVRQTLFESLPTIDLVMSRLFGLSV